MSESPRARTAVDRGDLDDPSIPVLSDRIYLPALDLDIAVPTQPPGSGPGRLSASSLRPAGGEVDILGDTTGATITAAALIDAARRELAPKGAPPVAAPVPIADDEAAIETELDADLAADLDADLEALLQVERDLSRDAAEMAVPAPAVEPTEAPPTVLAPVEFDTTITPSSTDEPAAAAAPADEAVEFDTTIIPSSTDEPAAAVAAAAGGVVEFDTTIIPSSTDEPAASVAVPADGAVEFDTAISLPLPAGPAAVAAPADGAIDFDTTISLPLPAGHDETPAASAEAAIETPAADDRAALDVQAEALRHAVLAGVAQRLPERIDATMRDLMQPAIDDAIARLGDEAQVALRITLQELVEQVLREELARRR